MSKDLTQEQLSSLIDTGIKRVSDLLNELRSNPKEKRSYKKAGLIAYWLIDYVKMLKKEKNFDASKMLRYYRGDIVCVNFGYRVGRELGGKHFAVVLDNYNSHNSDVMTVVPLKSKKSTYKESIFQYELEYGIYELHKLKFENMTKECYQELEKLKSENGYYGSTPNEDSLKVFSKHIKALSKKISDANNVRTDIFKLKEGSIADLGQIITISKIRIINPCNASDSLKGISLKEKDMDVISKKIKYLYLH